MPLLRIVVAASVAMLIAGCGADDDADSTPAATPSPPVAESPEPASTPSGDPEALSLAKSALGAAIASEAYTVDSRLDVTTGDQVQRTSNRIRYVAPQRYLSEMNIGEDRIEILVVPPSIFVRRVGEEWYAVDAESDPTLPLLARSQGLREYVELFERLQDAEALPPDDVDGEPHDRVRARFDLADYIATLPPGSVTEETIAAADSAEPATLDLWLDPDTERIRRMVLRLQLRVEDIPVIFVGALDVTGYDDTSGFPEAPGGVPPFRGFDDEEDAEE